MAKVTKQVVRKQVRARKGSLTDRIAPVRRVETGIKMNIYGHSGTGKTTLASTFPKPLLHVVCSGIGLEESESIANVKGIDDVELLSSNEIAEVVQQGDRGKYKTIVLDHITGFQDLIIKEILGLDESPVALYRVAGKGQSWGVVSQQQYGQLGIQMREWLRALLTLPCNVVILAQEREFNIESEGDVLTPYVASAVTPSVLKWLNPACSYRCQTFIRQKQATEQRRIGKKQITITRKLRGVEYCLRTMPHPVYNVRFRLLRGVELPELIVDPSYAKIKKLIG